jgi:hypothetical protein
VVVVLIFLFWGGGSGAMALPQALFDRTENPSCVGPRMALGLVGDTLFFSFCGSFIHKGCVILSLARLQHACASQMASMLGVAREACPACACSFAQANLGRTQNLCSALKRGPGCG